MAPVKTSVLEQEILRIMREEDLEQLTSKKIRKRLEEKYQTDLTDRKKDLDDIVMKEVTRQRMLAEDKDSASDSSSSAGSASGNSGSDQSDDDDDDGKMDDKEDEDEKVEDEAPKKKKPKQQPAKKRKMPSPPKASTSTKKKKPAKLSPAKLVDADAQLAIKLQEQEDKGLRQTRSGRMPSSRKSPKKTKKEGEGKKAKKSGGGSYSKLCVLSPALAAVVGADQMKRCDVVKRMWEVFKERNLQDPKNKSFASCDMELQKLFGRKKVRMFGMMKYLSHHINPEPE